MNRQELENSSKNAANVNRRNKNKNVNKKKIIIFSSIILVTVLAVLYLSVSVFFQYHFIQGTKINGIDCSYKSVSAVEEMLYEEIRTYYLMLIQRNNTVEHVSAEDIKLTMSIEGNVDAILENQNSYLWLFTSGNEHTIETKVEFDENALTSRMNTLECLDEDKMTDAKPPEIVFENGAYSMGKAEPGTRVNTEKLKELIKNAISNLDKELNLEETGCYMVSLNESEEDYLEVLNTLNKYAGVEITLTFRDEKEPVVIDCDRISNWLSVNEKLEIEFDMEAIEAYVGTISKEIETMGQTRKFTNSYGNEINIYGGDYGWWISESMEAEAIVNDIKGGKNVTREMNYLQEAASFGESDLGNTYIEINLITQHLFCYKDGELLTECDIISGTNVNPTPTGIYRMRFMFKNYTFEREYFNRTVPYWMVFYGNDADSNIGLISCDWRTDFGGTTYLYNGTHGSIFVPAQPASVIYREIPNDIPVIIYKTY